MGAVLCFGVRLAGIYFDLSVPTAPDRRRDT
jgi:hypothetical protein